MAGNFIDYFRQSMWKTPPKQPIHLPEEFTFSKVHAASMRHQKNIPEFDAMVGDAKNKYHLKSANPASIGLGNPHASSHRRDPGNIYGVFEDSFPPIKEHGGYIAAAYEHKNAGKSSAAVAQKIRFQNMDDEEAKGLQYVMEQLNLQNASNENGGDIGEENEEQEIEESAPQVVTPHKKDDEPFVQSLQTEAKKDVDSDFGTPSTGGETSEKKKRGKRSSHGGQSASKELKFDEEEGIDSAGLNDTPMFLFTSTLDKNTGVKPDTLIKGFSNVGKDWNAIKSQYKKLMDREEWETIFYDKKKHTELTWGEVRDARRAIEKWGNRKK